MLNRRRILMRIADWRLPDEYEYANYIATPENTAAWIDTEFGTGLDASLIDIETKCAWVGGESNVSAAVFGSRTNASSENFIILRSGATKNVLNVRYYKGNSNGTSTNLQYTKYVDGTPIVIKLSRNGIRKNLYIDNTLIGTTNSTNRVPALHDIYLMAVNEKNSGEVSNYNGIRIIYYFKIWYDSTPVRDFIPVRRKEDGKIGLFCRITNRFYVSPNGVNFTSGGRAI